MVCNRRDDISVRVGLMFHLSLFLNGVSKDRLKIDHVGILLEVPNNIQIHIVFLILSSWHYKPLASNIIILQTTPKQFLQLVYGSGRVAGTSPLSTFQGPP